MLAILPLRELKEFASMIELERIIIATDIYNAHLFELAACDGGARLALHQMFGSGAVFENFDTSRCHSQKTFLPLLGYFLGKFVLLIEDGCTNETITIETKIFNAANRHR